MDCSTYSCGTLARGLVMRRTKMAFSLLPFLLLFLLLHPSSSPSQYLLVSAYDNHQEENVRKEGIPNKVSIEISDGKIMSTNRRDGGRGSSNGGGKGSSGNKSKHTAIIPLYGAGVIAGAGDRNGINKGHSKHKNGATTNSINFTNLAYGALAGLFLMVAC
ncbi:hypothetical protein NMG60_11033409 [Bertholletia excelsa]